MLPADAGHPISRSSSRIWAARMGGHGRRDPSGMPRQTSERSMSASLTRATPASQSAKSFASRGACRKTGRGLSCRDRSWTCLIPTKSSGFPGPGGSTAEVDYELGVPYNIYSTKQAGCRGHKVSHQLNQRSHFRGIVCSMLLRKPHATGSHQSTISIPDHKSTTA